MKNLKGPATQKQKDALVSYGFSFKKGITKQEASEVITEKMKARRKITPDCTNCNGFSDNAVNHFIGRKICYCGFREDLYEEEEQY